jgi:hypothetical protein
VDLVGTDNAQKEFEELLAAAWAAQLAQVRSQANSADSVTRNGDKVEAQEAGK